MSTNVPLAIARALRTVGKQALPYALTALALVACGTGGTSSSTSSSTSSATNARVDKCVVGTWKSVSTSGTLKNSDGSISIALSGGTGIVSHIASDGTVRTDYSNAQPETGKGSDRGAYEVTFAGSLTGHLLASNGQATLTIDDPNSSTETISKDGQVVATLHPPKTGTSGYGCTSKAALAVSSGGVITTYEPA